jgi:hypothetical protein
MTLETGLKCLIHVIILVRCKSEYNVISVPLYGPLKGMRILIQKPCVLYLFSGTAIPCPNNASKTELMNEMI